MRVAKMLLHSAAPLSTMWSGVGEIILAITRTRPVPDVRAVNRKFQFLCVSGALLFFVGCATPPADPAGGAKSAPPNDPPEPMNRVIFGFNDILDTFLFKPVAQAYRFVFPQFSRN